MRSLAILTTCLFIGVVAWLQGSSQACTGMADEKYLPEVQKIIDGILAAKYPHDRFYGEDNYSVLFKKVGTDGLKKLQTHPDDSIALQAAWQEIELAAPVENNGPTIPADPKKLDQFLKFMESRCKIKGPDWWNEALLHANVNRRYNIWLTGPKPDIYHKAGVDFVLAPLDTTLVRDGMKLTLKVSNDSINLPDNLFSKWSSGKLQDNISALFTAKRCYVAVHDDWGGSYKLSCLDRSTAKLLWQREVWGTSWGGGSGLSRGWVAITEQKNRIVLYGCEARFHVEAFRAEDGKNLFRFSNGYMLQD